MLTVIVEEQCLCRALPFIVTGTDGLCNSELTMHKSVFLFRKACPDKNYRISDKTLFAIDRVLETL